MNMKKLMLVVASVMVIGSIAVAQQVKSKSERVEKAQVNPEVMAQKRTERLNEAVHLTDAQKAKVNAIYLKQAQENASRAAYNKETETAVKAELTDAQLAQYEQAKERRKAAMAERRTQVKRGETKMSPAGSETQTKE